MSRTAFPSAHFYGTLSACLTRWDLDGHHLPNAASGWLEVAVSAAIAEIVATLRDGDDPSPWSGVALSMARDAHIPEAFASALLVRVYIDALGYEAFHHLAVSQTDARLRDQLAQTWAELACAAFAAGWYPEFKGKPATAAGVLSDGYKGYWRPLATRLDASKPHPLARLAQHFHLTALPAGALAPPSRDVYLPARSIGSPMPKAIARRSGMEDFCASLTVLGRDAGLPAELCATIADQVAATMRGYITAPAVSDSPTEQLFTTATPVPSLPAPAESPATEPLPSATTSEPALKVPEAPPTPSFIEHRPARASAPPVDNGAGRDRPFGILPAAGPSRAIPGAAAL